MTTDAAGPRRVYRNQAARAWRCEPLTGMGEFHAALPGYEPTPLVELPALAAELGVGRVFVKDESSSMVALGNAGAAHADATKVSYATAADRNVLP